MTPHSSTPNCHIHFRITSPWPRGARSHNKTSPIEYRKTLSRCALANPRAPPRFLRRHGRIGDHVRRRKMPAESSSHVQRRDNVVASLFPQPPLVPLSLYIRISLSLSLLLSNPFLLPRVLASSSLLVFSFKSRPFVRSPGNIQKERARAQRSHATQIEAAG